MYKKTTIHFFGSMITEFPQLISASKKMASGNVMAWVDASINVVGAVGDILNLCIDRNNTRLLKEEIDNIDLTEKIDQKQLEQEMLKKKQSAINDMKSEFSKNKKQLQEIYIAEKMSIYRSKIEELNAISSIMSNMRTNLKELIDEYKNEISGIISSGEYSQKEKRHFEDCERLLLMQYYKNIDI